MIAAKADGSTRARCHQPGGRRWPSGPIGRRWPGAPGGARWLGAVLLGLVVVTGVLPGAAQTTTAPTTTTTATTASTTASTTTTTAPTTTAPPTTTTAPPTTATTAAPTTARATTAAPTTATTAPSTTTATTAPGSTTPTTSATSGATNQAERDRLQAAESAKARQVDAANARLDDLSDALAVLKADVASQTAEVEIANRRLTDALARAEAAEQDVVALEAQVRGLEYGLSDQAIRSFKGEIVEGAVLAVGTDPNQAIRMQAMLAKATQSDIDYANVLSNVKEDLEIRRAAADEAVAIADQSRAESQAELAELEDDRLAQGQLAAAAEQRLDHLLSERAALARLGADEEAGLDVDVENELVAQLASAPAPPPSSSTPAAATTSNSDIRVAGNGIEVHVSIVDDVRRLLADAAADGVELAGGGYRDSAGQIATRRNNCGTSNYAIYEMPSSRCRPPTARPGRSMHEQGKAIDFTYNGSIIRSRSGPAWNWLRANAEKYGLYNLPSEPWHWSTNGR